MIKVSKAEGFVSAEIKSMPKNVRFLHGAPDGAYITLVAQTAERSKASNNYSAKKSMPAGSLMIVTEGGHLYTLNGSGGFVGLGKSVRDSYSSMLVQRVKIAVTVSDFRVQTKKKKVTKKKAKKKKKKKTSKTPKTRTTGRGRW